MFKHWVELHCPFLAFGIDKERDFAPAQKLQDFFS
jgi:hypothetical protein